MIGNIGSTQGVNASARPKMKNETSKTTGEIFCSIPVNNPASSLADHSSDKPNFFGAVKSIRASAISTVGLLNTATQGSVDFYLLISTLP